MYDRNAGYNGNTHGDTKDKNPAPNARNIFTSGKENRPLLTHSVFISKIFPIIAPFQITISRATAKIYKITENSVS